MINAAGLGRISLPYRDGVRRYAERFIELAQPGLHSLTVWGPIATSGFDPAVHVIHSAAVLEQVDLQALRHLAFQGHQFGRQRIAAPLVLTPRFLVASRDTYPLELIEIQQQCLVVAGDDAWAGLEFDAPHVRLQCERELKVVALAMRQAVVTEGAHERALRRAAWPPIAGLLRILRGMLWLTGQREPLAPQALVCDVERHYGLTLPGVRRVIESPRSAQWEAFVQFYNDIELLGGAVDDR